VDAFADVILSIGMTWSLVGTFGLRLLLLAMLLAWSITERAKIHMHTSRGTIICSRLL
jgi:hypothetical protein